MQSDERFEQLANKINKACETLPAAEDIASAVFAGHSSIVNAGGTQIVMNHAPPVLTLTPEQRFRLNTLVTEISKEFDIDCRDLWRNEVHAVAGVSTVSDIPRERFHDVLLVLEERDRKERRARHVKQLSASIDLLVKQRGGKSKMQEFALAEFGHCRLDKLSPVELKALLTHLEGSLRSDFGLPFNAVPIGVNSNRSAAKQIKTAGLRRWWRMMWRLVLRWPTHVLVVALSSALAGKIFL